MKKNWAKATHLFPLLTKVTFFPNAPEGKKEAGIISLDELIVRVSLSDCATIAGLALDFCSTEMDFLNNKTPLLFFDVFPYFYSDL